MPRSPEPGPTPAERDEQRGVWNSRMLWGLAAIILGFYGVDVLYLGSFSVWALVFRLGWVVSLLLMWGIPGDSSSGARWRVYVSVGLSGICVAGLSFVMGGVGSPYFVMVPTLPLGTALVLREDRRATLAAGGVSFVGTLVLVGGANHSFAERLTWVLMMMGTAVLADFLSRQARHVQTAEQQARLERARRESLEALALSEHRRAQSEKLAIVGRLASGVAHEINNPIAYVGSNVDFVRNELTSGREVDREELAEVLAETRVGIQHIRQVVADLRGFARMDANEPTPCSLADVVADAMKLASLRLKHVALLRVDVPADLPEIFAVRQRLVQVLLNLLVNAGDVLESHKVEGGEVRVTGRAEQERVVLLVEDNGPGFAPHVLSRLFEAFFTTKSPEKGTGLGLTLSRELVEQFGGALTASNRPEGGARLRIELPVRPVEPPEEEPSTAPEGGAQGAA
ncbi:ATP-binding protein [Vitiosangium sp. GDMCC 1.1324]|uniref:ATP-binding protein n=1 Tax=Vitiosangium sp. (strain GDMCC 1.1324) TaxID=2138576 RepID=UPI0011B71670|nr:ATP-binding protein [Vitiosangium sp. GDMCC 1.1324]